MTGAYGFFHGDGKMGGKNGKLLPKKEAGFQTKTFKANTGIEV